MDIREMVKTENKLGARLRIVTNPLRPETDGPLRLIGTDRKGRRQKIAGDEAFICKMLLIISGDSQTATQS